MLYKPRVPMFYGFGSTDDERKAVQHQNGLLSQLSSFVLKYQSAIILITEEKERMKTLLQEDEALGSPTSENAVEWSKKRELIWTQLELAGQWMQMASRDAVMTVFHFGKTLDAIGFKGSPALADAVDRKALSAARARFQKHFRDNSAVRNATAHSAERVATPDAIDKIRHSGEVDTAQIKNKIGVDLVLSETMINNHMTSTVVHPHTGETSVVSGPVTAEAFQELVAIANEVFVAFKGAEDARFTPRKTPDPPQAGTETSKGDP